MATDLSDKEAAILVGKHPRTIQRWCAAGKLLGSYKAGRSWRIPREALFKAGLGGALAGDPAGAELDSAIALCEQLRRELELQKMRGVRIVGRRQTGEPGEHGKWRVLARKLERLERALAGLAELAAQVPRR